MNDVVKEVTRVAEVSGQVHVHDIYSVQVREISQKNGRPCLKCSTKLAEVKTNLVCVHEDAKEVQTVIEVVEMLQQHTVSNSSEISDIVYM